MSKLAIQMSEIIEVTTAMFSRAVQGNIRVTGNDGGESQFVISVGAVRYGEDPWSEPRTHAWEVGAMRPIAFVHIPNSVLFSAEQFGKVAICIVALFNEYHKRWPT